MEIDGATQYCEAPNTGLFTPAFIGNSFPPPPKYTSTPNLI